MNIFELFLLPKEKIDPKFQQQQADVQILIHIQLKIMTQFQNLISNLFSSQLLDENEINKFFKLVITEHSEKIDPKLIVPQRKESVSEEQEDFNPEIHKKYFEISSDLGFSENNYLILSQVLQNDLKQFVKYQQQQQQNGNYGFQPFLFLCYDYFENFQKNFLKNVCSYIELALQDKIDYDREFTQKKVEEIQEFIFFTIQEEFLNSGKAHFFDIILSYPESFEIINQIKQSLENVNIIEDMSSSLLESINKRLLIPGVITQTILSFFINCLKVMQIVDPKGITFKNITQPIKNYLLNRNDTIRCIISLLTEDHENYSKLTRELVKIPSKDQQIDLSSDEDEKMAEKWEICSLVEKKKEPIRVKYQESDLLSILVNLYGSQEAFLTEYQNMLAEKMMGTKEFDIDQEIKNLELLKLRCGDQNLQNCNIIVKDMKDSKRVDTLIHDNLKQKQQNKQKQIPGTSQLLPVEQLHCIFVSKGFWPINYEAEPIPIPPQFESVFQNYQNEYSSIKAMRKLIWHTNLGHVNLSLTFENGEFDFKCLPIHAQLISFFDESKYDLKNGVMSEFLAQESQITHQMVKQKMAFWIHKGVIREEKVPKNRRSFGQQSMIDGFEADPIKYFVVEKYEMQKDQENLILCDEEDNEIILKEQSFNNLESSQFLKVVENVILQLLGSSGPKTLKKIVGLLKTVYNQDLNCVLNEQKTKEVLKILIQKRKITLTGEYYKIVRE